MRILTISLILNLGIVMSMFGQDSTNIYCKVDSYDFNKVDTMIKHIPSNITEIEKICSYIDKHTSNELEKVRGIYMWIHFNIKYGDNIDLSKLNNDQLIYHFSNEWIYCFKYRKGICCEISPLFVKMCSLLRIKSNEIEGVCKKEYTNGLLSTHVWNSVEINGEKLLIDPTWGLNDIKGWFIVPPEIMIFTHFPLKLIYTYDMLVSGPDPRMGKLIDGRQLIKYSMTDNKIYDLKNQLLEVNMTASWFLSNDGYHPYTQIKYNRKQECINNGSYLFSNFKTITLPINKYPHTI